MPLRVYRVDVSNLDASEKHDLGDRLDQSAFIVQCELSNKGVVAYRVFWEFGEFPGSIPIPDGCAITDITGTDLTRR